MAERGSKPRLRELQELDYTEPVLTFLDIADPLLPAAQAPDPTCGQRRWSSRSAVARSSIRPDSCRGAVNYSAMA
jgi:hypothetical protein